MGYHLVVHAEVKIGGNWHYFRSVDYPNYSNLKSLIGDFDDDDSPPYAIPPRGLPGDLSSITQLYADHAQDGTRSFGWLSEHEARELGPCIAKELDITTHDIYAVTQDFQRGIQNLDACSGSIQSYRWVYWFVY